MLESIQAPEALASAALMMYQSQSFSSPNADSAEVVPPAPYDEVVDMEDVISDTLNQTSHSGGHVAVASAPPYNAQSQLSSASEEPLQQSQVFSVNAVTVQSTTPSGPNTSRTESGSNVFFVTANFVSSPPPTQPVMATIVQANQPPQLAVMVNGSPSTRPVSATVVSHSPALTASNLATTTRRAKSARSNYSMTSKSSSAQSLLYAAPRDSPKERQVSFSLKSMMDSLQGFQDNMAGKMERIRNEKKKEKVDEHQARELFPRMP